MVCPLKTASINILLQLEPSGQQVLQDHQDYLEETDEMEIMASQALLVQMVEMEEMAEMVRHTLNVIENIT